MIGQIVGGPRARNANLTFENGDTTGDLDDDLISDEIDIEGEGPMSVGCHFEWTTTDAVGPITAEVNLAGAHWHPLDDLSVQVNGADGIDFVDIERLKASKLRFKFTRTAGTAGVLSGVYTVRHG